MAKSRSIRVEVVCARPAQQAVTSVELAPGGTIADALRASGWLRHCAEIDFTTGKFGIFGCLATPDAVLHDGDRVEIYRPLTISPKEARRLRAARKSADQVPGVGAVLVSGTVLGFGGR